MPDETPQPPAPEEEEQPPPKSTLTLGQRLLRGSGWTLLAHGIGNGLRLGGNLLMTRLLFPEAFGLMAIVTSFVQGLNMFSDVGIGPSIIQNAKGGTDRFRHTAWTIQTMRGLALFLFACALAYPASRFYGEPQLLQLLPATALTALLSGFNSTKVFTLQRDIDLKRIVILDLIVQVVSLSAMIAFALVWPSVWALVAGNLVAAVIKLAGSHLFLPGDRDWFAWDRESMRELIRFGRWVFPSTILTFLSLRSDRLILGRFLTMGQLGLYNIAFFLATALQEVVSKLAERVLFPYYARLSEAAPEEARATIQRVRIRLLALCIAPLAGVVAWGPVIIRILYDERYHSAGWMLQVLAIGTGPAVVQLTSMPIVLARGDSFRHMLVMGWTAVVLLGGMVVGGSQWGTDGLVYAIAAAPALSYPAMAWAVSRHGMWQPKLDAAALAILAALAGLLSLVPLPF